MHVAVQERADVFVSRRNVVLFQNAQNDSRIGHARDLDVVQIVINPETLFESRLERVYARAAGMNQRAVDVEKQQSLCSRCGPERSRGSPWNNLNGKATGFFDFARNDEVTISKLFFRQLLSAQRGLLVPSRRTVNCAKLNGIDQPSQSTRAPDQ